MNITWIEQSVRILSDRHATQLSRLLGNDKEIRNVHRDGDLIKYEHKYWNAEVCKDEI